MIICLEKRRYKGEEVGKGEKCKISTVPRGKIITLEKGGGGAKISHFGQIYTPGFFLTMLFRSFRVINPKH